MSSIFEDLFREKKPWEQMLDLAREWRALSDRCKALWPSKDQKSDDLPS